MIRLISYLFLFSTLFTFVLLVTFGCNGQLICNAANPEHSELTTIEKTLTILSEVVGLDVETYNITLDLHNQDLYLQSLPQEDVQYTLDSEDSKVEVICNFVNKKLQSIFLHTLDGTLRMAQPCTNILDATKAFLDRYRAYSGAPYIDDMRDMLDTVDGNENVTKIAENIKLDVTVNQNSATFRWTPAVNGVDVMFKWVILGFENRSLAVFMDNWELYNIGSYEMSISEEEAIDIALKTIENYSWIVHMGGDKAPVEVAEFNVEGVSETKLTFCNYPSKNESRNGDPLTLYPNWNIKLYFDKLYLGNVYGVNIAIWADTGEVNDIRPLIWMGEYSFDGSLNDNETPSETNPNQAANAWLVLPLAVALGVVIVHSKRKKASNELYKTPKSCSIKLSGVLFCVMMGFSMALMAPRTVNAEDRGLICWGARWMVIDSERTAAQNVIDTMITYFGNRGYTCYDCYGSQTLKESVLAHAETMEENFDYVAMFHHGHAGKMYGHWDYFDDYGPYSGNNHLIWDYEVYPKTWRQKHIFVMLLACRQGDVIYMMELMNMA